MFFENQLWNQDSYSLTVILTELPEDNLLNLFYSLCCQIAAFVHFWEANSSWRKLTNNDESWRQGSCDEFFSHVIFLLVHKTIRVNYLMLKLNIFVSVKSLITSRKIIQVLRVLSSKHFTPATGHLLFRSIHDINTRWLEEEKVPLHPTACLSRTSFWS